MCIRDSVDIERNTRGEGGFLDINWRWGTKARGAKGIRYPCSPVSYTHLDVYKRQVVRHTLVILLMGPAISNGVELETLRTISLPLFFKQKTAYEIASGDWSSDVCSSDLIWWIGHLVSCIHDWECDVIWWSLSVISICLLYTSYIYLNLYNRLQCNL